MGAASWPGDVGRLTEHSGEGTTFRQPPAGVAWAGWWSRVGATLIDGVIVSAAFAVTALVFGIIGNNAALAVALVVVYIGATFGYAPVMLAYNDGRTVGKLAVGIRVVDADGRPIGFGRALLRETIVKWVLSFTIVLVPLWPLWDRENRTLHDMVVSTRVVRD